MPDFDKLAEESVNFKRDLTEKRLSAQVADLRSRLGHAMREHDALEKELAQVSEIDLAKVQPKALPSRSNVRAGRSESVPVVLCSDWHVMESVDPETVNGKNRFNPAICAERVATLAHKIQTMVEIFRGSTTIDSMVLALLGDFINGMIHDDAKESNFGSPVEEVEAAYALICGLIDAILRDSKMKSLTIPCAMGNHGRDTLKPRSTTAWKRNYEWLIYVRLVERYDSNKRVAFVLSKSPHVIQEVYGRKIRFHHGDMIKYHGGVGGLTVPANKAINEWNKSDHVWMDCFGHYHRFFYGGNFIANGSLVGFNAYALQIKAGYELPTQTFFLVEKELGLTSINPLYLERK